MIPFYRDYCWKKGIPHGLQKLESLGQEVCYRLVADPYRKWMTIEEYERGQFKNIVYDSRFLDFRKLSAKDQLAWRRIQKREGEAWIFNEDDRLILKEEYLFEKERCQKVSIFSPYGNLICFYEMPENLEEEIFLKDCTHSLVAKRVPGQRALVGLHS